MLTLLEKFLGPPPSPIFGWSYPLTPLLKHNRLDIATYPPPRSLPPLPLTPQRAIGNETYDALNGL